MEVELKEGKGHSRHLLLEEKGKEVGFLFVCFWGFCLFVLALTFLVKTLGEGPKIGMGFDS